jgi:hypothetical protein
MNTDELYEFLSEDVDFDRRVTISKFGESIKIEKEPTRRGTLYVKMDSGEVEISGGNRAEPVDTTCPIDKEELREVLLPTVNYKL